MRNILFAIVVSAAGLGHAGTILGLDDANLYRIDTTTGVATVVASLAGHGTGDANALAYDAAKGMAYYQRGGSLWSVDLTSGAFAQTGYTVGDVASATFANGEYVYGTASSLMAVDFSGTNPLTLGTYNKGWNFGDVATSGNLLYGSSGSSTFRVDLGTGVYTALGSTGHSLQLGFSGSTLYGVANGNAGAPAGEIYTIDLGTGTQSDTGIVARYNGTALSIRDAASYPGVGGVQATPEPSALAAVAVGALGLLRRRKKA